MAVTVLLKVTFAVMKHMTEKYRLHFSPKYV